MDKTYLLHMRKRTFKKSKSSPDHNNYLLAKPVYLGDQNIPMSIELIQYDSMRVEVKNIQLQSPVKDQIDKTKVNWIKITGISDANEVSRICKELGLHSFDVKDLLADQQVVKVVEYERISYILMSAFYQDRNIIDIDDMQVAFILGEHFIVSFQEGTIPIFDEVKKNIEENNVLIRQKDTDFLLYILLNAVNAFNINTVMDVEDKLANVEDQLILGKGSIDILKLLHECRVDYMHIRRSIMSLREEFTNLLHNTNKLIKDENMVYFNNFDDRMRTTLGDLSSFHESLTSLLDLYYNNNNLKMNDIMKRLTIVSTIFIPLTFMVGVWGMNFKFMPEVEWKYGYLSAWLVLIVIAVLSYLWIRKQKWF